MALQDEPEKEGKDEHDSHDWRVSQASENVHRVLVGVVSVSLHHFPPLARAIAVAIYER